MNLLLLNPNTTAAMTRAMAAVAQAIAAPGTQVLARNPASGPASIQGPEDGAAAVPGVLAEIARGRAEGVDASIIACFDDTGLAQARAATDRPVIGIGEAAFHAAALSGARFSVVTTLAVSIPVIEANIAAYGFQSRCARVRASGVPVLELTAPGAAARVIAEAQAAAAEDGVQAIVLGCSGMAALARPIEAACGLPAIDGVRAAVLLAEALVRLRRA